MVSGELVELDSEALGFGPGRSRSSSGSSTASRCRPRAAAALTRRTGGWAAGLMLFHLSTSGKSAVERERAVADLGGRSRLLRSYLTRTVLDELDPERREFLLATCTLGTLTGPLCDALLQREGSAAVLEDLASRQFFTTLAENGRSYRYHQVLQTLLEGLLVDELGPRAAADLYAAARRCSSRRVCPGRRCAPTRWPRTSRRWRGCSSSRAPGLRSTRTLVGVDDAGDDPWLALVRARRLQRAVRSRRPWRRSARPRRCSTTPSSAGGAGRSARSPACGSPTRRPGPAGRGRGDATGRGPGRAGRDQPAPGADRCRRSRSPRASSCSSPASGPGRPQAGPRRPGLVAGAAVADLARVVAEIVDGGDGDPVATLEQIILTAEVEEQPWLARVARGVQAAVLLVTTEEPWRGESCASLVEECERSGDEWGAVLLAGALGVAQRAAA